MAVYQHRLIYHLHTSMIRGNDMRAFISKAYFVSKIFVAGFILGMLTAPYGLYARSDGLLINTYENAVRSNSSALPDATNVQYDTMEELIRGEQLLDDGFEFVPIPNKKPKRG